MERPADQLVALSERDRIQARYPLSRALCGPASFQRRVLENSYQIDLGALLSSIINGLRSLAERA